MADLTPKQEKFAQEVASGKTQADAYRAAYDAKNMKPETIQKRASELMGNGGITGRVAVLREAVARKAQMTLESHLDDLKVLRNMATKEGQLSVAVTAEIARGKAAGVCVERLELTGKNGKDLIPQSGVLVVPAALDAESWEKAVAEHQRGLVKN